ncbi:hypothetical protein BpHYR1_036241 [Brachionus plicatilis]|uniref:Uncharacterized protein n=1 Tax=Brachionus plicatilis TaxID=10195 RepID=A0A3M7RGP6_BRAPC|nr:hypothetical protein BpHYR1_036241 [Brachionus plicatilis]
MCFVLIVKNLFYSGNKVKQLLFHLRGKSEKSVQINSTSFLILLKRVVQNPENYRTKPKFWVLNQRHQSVCKIVAASVWKTMFNENTNLLILASQKMPLSNDLFLLFFCFLRSCNDMKLTLENNRKQKFKIQVNQQASILVSIKDQIDIIYQILSSEGPKYVLSSTMQDIN